MRAVEVVGSDAAVQASMPPADGAGPLGGQTATYVGQFQQPLQRTVLDAGQLLGAGWVDQVGASDGADQ